MLDNVEELERRARHLYAPVVVTRHDGTTFIQCERDEIAEARQRVYSALVVAAVPVLHFVAAVLVMPWRLWRMVRP